MNANMAQEISIYQGDTFYAEGLYTLADGTPVDLNAGGITIESYVLARNGTKIDMNVAFLPSIGEYSITSDTETWPLGRITWHVRYTSGTNKRSAEAVIINVLDA